MNMFLFVANVITSKLGIKHVSLNIRLLQICKNALKRVIEMTRFSM
jgi:hypothetical protein